jgi:hypothetical protein
MPPNYIARVRPFAHVSRPDQHKLMDSQMFQLDQPSVWTSRIALSVTASPAYTAADESV